MARCSRAPVQPCSTAGGRAGGQRPAIRHSGALVTRLNKTRSGLVSLTENSVFCTQLSLVGCRFHVHRPFSFLQAMEHANGMELDGRRIRVDYSITKRAHTPTPGIYMGRPTQ